MRKAIGIFLLIIGSIIFLWSGYAFITYMATNKEDMIIKYEKRGVDANLFYKEGIDAHLKKGRWICAIVCVMGAGIAYAGYNSNKKTSTQ